MTVAETSIRTIVPTETGKMGVRPGVRGNLMSSLDDTLNRRQICCLLIYAALYFPEGRISQCHKIGLTVVPV